ncbi:hypothetical protein [Shimia sp.]|uniref:hypothetical protein n=1 Tax=Shimia sp. TaxID=1954381 RepID=UPI00329832E5
MKPIMTALCIALTAPMGVQAEEDEGYNLMEEGARLFLEGLQLQMEPAIEELQGFAQEIGPEMQSFFLEMGPAFRDLMSEVEDWSAYHPPETLPNGDIILRRKTPDEEATVPESGETDL